MKDFEGVKIFLSKITQIPPLEWFHLTTLLKVKSFKKGSVYFNQGDEVHEIGFVVKGLLYNSYIDSDGKELVKFFITERNLVAAYSSLILNKPAFYTCKTLEDTTLITIQYKDLKNLYKRHASWERMGRISAEKQFIAKELREYQFLANDAQARYESLVQEQPELVNRVPQYLIASYLGISPVSLSRIRGSFNGK